MPKGHLPLPRLWLMTDERMGARLIPSLLALPKGSGVIFRHYSLPASERRILFRAVRTVARRRRLFLLLAGPPRLARAWGARGAHGQVEGCISSPVHSVPQRIAAERRGARLLLISPLFETQSHIGRSALGRCRFGLISRNAQQPVVALGGLTRKKAQSLKQFGIYGWAAIDALTG